MNVRITTEEKYDYSNKFGFDFNFDNIQIEGEDFVRIQQLCDEARTIARKYIDILNEPVPEPVEDADRAAK